METSFGGSNGLGPKSVDAEDDPVFSFERSQVVSRSIAFLLFLSRTKKIKPAKAKRPSGTPTAAPTITAVLSLEPVEAVERVLPSTNTVPKLGVKVDDEQQLPS